MATVARPDGVTIHWETRGDGPAVLVALHAFARPEVYSDLLGLLAADHSVITYDPRGAGRSTRVPPADPADDVGDLEAVLEEAGAATLIVAFGDAGWRAAVVAEQRPDLVRSVVAAGATPVPPLALRGAEGPVASPSTVAALFELAQHNPRAGLRGLLELTNPGMTPEALRARVDSSLDYHLAEGLLKRLRWYYHASIEPMRALGDRFWIAQWESAWSPREVRGAIQEALPMSRIQTVGEGPIARPDLTADLVRRAVASVSEPRI